MKLFSFFLLIVVVYSGSYIWFRQHNTEVWAADGKAYVIFPPYRSIVYYAYRPASYVDEQLTGTRAHIGPHE